MRNRAKIFIENFLAYGAINVLNKVVPLLMLPIITRLLTDTAEFGRFDMFNTIVSFGSSFAMLGMYDAMFREYFEKDDKDYKDQVTSTALIIVLISSVVVTVIMIIFNRFFSQIFLGNKQSGFIVITAALGVFFISSKNIISAPTRIENKRKVYVVSGLLNSICYYLLALILVVRGSGYKGLIFANLISTIVIIIFFSLKNRRYFNLKVYNKTIGKELFKVGLPILPTFIIYWVFSSMDKIMIANILDVSQVGIYSIGARVASISNFVYMAFSGGWQYFAFSTMKDTDQVELNSKVFEYLGIISFIIFLISTIFNEFLFKFVFEGDYVLGFVVFPYLFLSPLLLMLFQVSGNQFLVIKKSYLITVSLVFGAIANIVLNYFLIQLYGVKGSALATLIGYSISVIMMTIMTQKRELLKLKPRFLLSSILTTIVIIGIFLLGSSLNYMFSITVVLIILVLYVDDLKVIRKKLFENRISNKRCK